MDVAGEIYAPDYVLHDPAIPEETRGPEGAKRLAAAYRGAFPDLRTTVGDLIAEGDRVVYRWTASGTHRAALMGIRPTGKRVAVEGIAINRIADGRIAEAWQIFDARGMMHQLSVVPPPGQGAGQATG